MILKDKSYFKYKIPNFKNLKKDLIKLIYKSKCHNINEKGERISFSDWKYSKDDSRKYILFIFDKIIKNFCKEFCKINNCKSISILNMWFQIYKTGDFHSMHVHPETNFTNIIYISIPTNKVKTNVYSLEKDKINLDVEEGEILTFPAFFPHESPVNNCNNNKIIVSFNSNIMEI